MNKFKAGDKVRCIDDDGGSFEHLKRGEIYTVKEHLHWIFLVEHDNVTGGWLPSRFELVEEIHQKFKIGDKVVYVGGEVDLHYGAPKLVIGEEHEITFMPPDTYKEQYITLETKYSYDPSLFVLSGEYKEDLAVFDETHDEIIQSKIKSDGGSSDYYKINIRTLDGREFSCETNDIIYALVGGDFNLGNVVKACRRMYLDSLGKGKEGTDLDYDYQKCLWFLKDFNSRNGKVG